MFLTISYISNASDKLTVEDVEALMVDVKIFNDENNIKGILIYSDNTFFQIIEGEYHQILSLFERIKKDIRHYGILKILERKCDQSRYDRFNGHYITYNNNKANAELLRFLEINSDHMPDQKLHNLIVYQFKVLLSIK